MIYVFLGKEINIINRKASELISSLKIDNIIKYDYNEYSLNDILDEACYVDLFNEKKLIIVSNFSFKKIKENEEQRLITYIDIMPENVIIFKCAEEELDSRKKLTKLIKEKCKIQDCKKMDYKELLSYVTDIFKKENKKITSNQIYKILERCKYNNDITLNEVEKLLLYKIGEEVISDEDIDNVISTNTEKEIFTLMEYAMNKNIGGCFDSYKILTSGSVDAIVIIDSLAKQFRMLYQTKELIKTNNENVVAGMLNVDPYKIKKLLPYTKKLSDEEIIDIMYKLSICDENIKINSMDKNEALELFFVSL